VQEAHIECQRREFEARKAQEQQQRSQAQAEAIAATQGSGEATAVPAAATGGRRSACVRCREHLNNPVGCIAQASSKATVCAQVMLVEYRGEGRGELDGSREWHRDRRSGGAEAGGEKAAAERGEYVAKGSQQAQEGAQHDRGGRGRRGGGIWGALSDGGGAARCAGYAYPDASAARRADGGVRGAGAGVGRNREGAPRIRVGASGVGEEARSDGRKADGRNGPNHGHAVSRTKHVWYCGHGES